MNMHRDQDGVKGVELAMGLLMMGILAALAIPLMLKVSDRVEGVAAAAEVRAEAVVSAAGLDETQVAGVQLVRATDGATCQWTQSTAGTVFGVWQSGATTLYGSFAEQPAECPVAEQAEAIGFSASFVGP